MSAAPLASAEFAALMAPFAPFERPPHLAVAVSGGADSMALTLLAHRWAAAQGGRVTALSVDHKLRPEAAAEARQVGRWLRPRKIAHRILEREPDGAGGNLQAAARAARYRLLEDWCAQSGVLHLLLAHHREDQAETLLLRLARGSGLDGLASMAAVVERAPCRLLRPLLPVPRPRLLATLEAEGQAWIEDPSNRDEAYARVRLRRLEPLLAATGLGAPRLAATAGRLARARAALEGAVAGLLGRTALVHPAGFVSLDRAELLGVPAEVGLRALAAVLTMVGGAEYPPRLERLERLYAGLAAGLEGGRTLGGCRVLQRRGGLTVCREPAAVAAPASAVPGKPLAWDGRFRLSLPLGAPRGLSLGALGGAPVAAPRLPAVIRAGLPALSDDTSVAAVPALGYVRAGFDADWLTPRTLVFRPTRPMSGTGFTVV